MFSAIFIKPVKFVVSKGRKAFHLCISPTTTGRAFKYRFFAGKLSRFLDSGASHSIIGLSLIELFELAVNRDDTFPCLSTADGVRQSVKGFVDLAIQIGDMLRLVRVLVVPSLTHSLILGSDFCRSFEITMGLF